MTVTFIKLFDPGTIGRLSVKNRIINAPMEKNLCSVDGLPGPAYVEYVRARAEGGVGLTLLEATYVTPLGKGHVYQLGVHSERVVDRLRAVVNAAHAHGTKVGVHLAHNGGVSEPEVTGRWPVAPSPVVAHRELPRELRTDEIPPIVQLFAASARLAVAAGVDLIELHGSHGYLIHQFFSPRTNRRTDMYGGTLEKRMRFPLEVVEAVRRAVGPHVPLAYRVSAEEFLDGGYPLADTLILAARLEAAGINLIDVSAGTYGSNNMIVQPMTFEPGGLARYSKAIKQVVRIPVSVAGRINAPSVAERLLEEGACDFVTIGRALHADPDFPRKAQAGRAAAIRPCIACYWCIDCMARNQPVKCAVNARAGNEHEGPPHRARTADNVAVVGGGPAGLEAASVAGERGHHVTLLERAPGLGGQLRYAARCLPEYGKLIPYYEQRLRDAGVTVQLNTEASLECLRALAPTAIVLATGARPVVDRVPHDDSIRYMAFDQVLGDGASGASRRAIVVGGGGIGCLTASWLGAQGTHVTLLEPGTEIALDVLPRLRAPLQEMLARHNVEIRTKCTLESVHAGRAQVATPGQLGEITDVDTVVVALRREPNEELAFELHRSASSARLYTVGDAVLPRSIPDAVREGYLVGARL